MFPKVNARSDDPDHRSNDLRTRTIRVVRESIGGVIPAPLLSLLRERLLHTKVGRKFVLRFAGIRERDGGRLYSIKLPSGYPDSRAHFRLSLPNLPLRPPYVFSEHVSDERGNATDTVLATTVGGFAISRDLGETWQVRTIRDPLYQGRRVLHLKSIGGSEFLAQTVRDSPTPENVENLILNETGEVLAATSIEGSPWHSCRSVDCASGTLMYAEYPYERPAGSPAIRGPSRVFRSRDRGRKWEIVFQCDRAQVQHFHFLQARPGRPVEWWLTSGDKPSESCIWVSRDDGDTWTELTAGFNDPVTIGTETLPRTVFRLTDLLWEEDQVVWGTDDYLSRGGLSLPGARMFRSSSSLLAPRFIGKAKWPIRNLVDVGEYYVILTQGCARSDASVDERMPGVYLMPKRSPESAPPIIHLFDVDVFSTGKTGFTCSRSSRSARNGTFFSHRGSTDAFPFGHKILQWNVTFS